ncbi:Bax inhibitor-1/YccA family protein [Spirochaeta thermophila]|uniref:Bax inhibitor-1/YccA family protein n=1 Tax=Winmispira thermophila (strain ATCC 49972 / DSM 6192 / RI 19.B1) TaxID=665571 RepID=E0RQR4_WINT6|nr:Bax inhibitor-1/YccA family protein [Spirochaeta thermophila]ADN02970.1 hypothetical protein STHERM_c20350 [Spirochaeta thermophila DSM 6192]
MLARPQALTGPQTGALQRILTNVYLWMTGGLALTGVVSLGVASSPALLRAFFSNPLIFFLLIGGELALVFYLSLRIQKMSPFAATVAFASYSALNGVTLAPLFLVYTGTSIAQVFFITAATFAGMSAYGYLTKRDLSRVGSIVGMALWGLIIASLVNIFLRSEGFSLVISYVGVLIFVGLTAYDTQVLKQWATQIDPSDESVYVRFSIMGALKLYLDFINLFLFLLRIMGSRRD